MEHELASVEKHYTQEGLYETILAALKDEGIEPEAVTRKDLAGVDEFHVRGQEVTRELAAMAGWSSSDKVLDAGCGLGGPARLLADEYGCEVTGIDITEAYIHTARKLSQLTGLDLKTEFVTGSVLDLPFADGTFDVAWTQHVQMNIKDKPRFYRELGRVLKPGGRLIYYDIFSVADQPIVFPVPWADSPAISHLITLNQLRSILHGIGFREMSRKDQTQNGIQFFSTLFEKMKTGSLPRISLRLLMGKEFSLKLGNLLRNLEEGRLTIEAGVYQKIPVAPL